MAFDRLMDPKIVSSDTLIHHANAWIAELVSHEKATPGKEPLSKDNVHDAAARIECLTAVTSGGW